MRNLTPSTDEDKLTELFKQYGEIEKVKKIKDYAFIHFKERENAVRAIEELNGQEIDEQKIEVALAKPQTDKKERRRGMSGFGALNAGKSAPMRMTRGGPRGGMRGSPMRGGAGMRGGQGRYDDWGYDSYGGGYDQGGYGGYDQGYQGYGDQGYGGGYGDSYYDDYYGGSGDQSYDSYYDSGSRGGRGGMSSRGTGGRGGGGRGLGQRGGAGGRGGPTGLGSRGAQRGGQRGGARGGMSGGRGGPSGGRGAPSGAGMKRKMDNSQPNQPKRQYGGEQGGGWNPQPIAQKPLSQSDGGNYYGYGGGSGNQEWYQDSYGQQWK